MTIAFDLETRLMMLAQEDELSLLLAMSEVRETFYRSFLFDRKGDTLRLLSACLGSGLLDVGQPSDDWKSFHPWPVEPNDAIAKIYQLWDVQTDSMEISEIAHFLTSERGLKAIKDENLQECEATLLSGCIERPRDLLFASDVDGRFDDLYWMKIKDTTAMLLAKLLREGSLLIVRVDGDPILSGRLQSCREDERQLGDEIKSELEHFRSQTHPLGRLWFAAARKP
jgi:hypothetical protein